MFRFTNSLCPFSCCFACSSTSSAPLFPRSQKLKHSPRTLVIQWQEDLVRSYLSLLSVLKSRQKVFWSRMNPRRGMRMSSQPKDLNPFYQEQLHQLVLFLIQWKKYINMQGCESQLLHSISGYLRPWKAKF